MGTEGNPHCSESSDFGNTPQERDFILPTAFPFNALSLVAGPRTFGTLPLVSCRSSGG